MKQKKYWLALILVIVLSLVVACGKVEEESLEKSEEVDGQAEVKEPTTVKFYYPDGIPALTVAKLVKEDKYIDENISIDYEMQKAPDVLVSKILKGEADIAIVPSNLAAQAFNKGIPYKLVGTSTWGSLYLVSTEDIETFEDLKGKEIYSFGRGLTPDIVLRYVLSQNNIEPNEDVEITYLNAASELGPAFISGKTNLAVLPEPLVTAIAMKKEDAKVVSSLNEEWSKATQSSKGYPQASLIIKSDLLENEKDFIEKFVKEYEKSEKWARENPEELGDYAEDLEISVKKAAIIEGQDRINMGFVEVKDCKEEYEVYFKTILDFAPESIGGKLPDEEFYFKR